jgi:hypothetical protein
MTATVISDETDRFGVRRVKLDLGDQGRLTLFIRPALRESSSEAAVIPIEPGTGHLPSVWFRFALEAPWESFRTAPEDEDRILEYVSANDENLGIALRHLLSR